MYIIILLVERTLIMFKDEGDREDQQKGTFPIHYYVTKRSRTKLLSYHWPTILYNLRIYA